MKRLPVREASQFTRRRTILGAVAAKRRSSRDVPRNLVTILMLLYGMGVVALFSTGRSDLRVAVLLLAIPVAGAIAIVRPEWLLVVVVLIPPSVMDQVSAMQMIALLGIALFGFILNGKLHLGPKTGIFPLVGIVALASFMKADVSAEASATADAVLKNLVYYTLLMLTSFQATANQRLRIDSFGDALVIGIVGAAIVQPFLPSIMGIEFSRNAFQGAFADLAVIGFGVTYVRRSLGPSSGRQPSWLDGALTVIFLLLIIVSYNRAAFVAALIIFGLVSSWTGKRTFWVVGALVVALAITIPVIRETIAPGGSIDISRPDTLEQVTSGRSVLWEELWRNGADAAPLGNGWGYTWSLTSNQLFGFEGAFSADARGIIYPHNDFLFLFLELGVIGVALLILFWLALVRRFRFLSGFSDRFVRYDARLLAPVFVVMFLEQLLANGLSVRSLAERFFISAGLMYGLHYTCSSSGRVEAARLSRV